MKISFLLFMVLSTAMSVSSLLQKEIELPKKCPTNPFSSHLERNNVSLLTKPIRSLRQSCGNEWKRYGMCCGELDLKEYAKKDEIDILRSARQVSSAFISLRNSFVKIREIGLKINKHEIEKLNDGPRAIIKFVRGNESLEFNQNFHELLFNRGFRKSLRHCWTTISAARSSALCSVCSGRSEKFFSGSKILLIDSDCNSILKECVPAFRTMVLIIEVLGEFFSTFQDSTKEFCPVLNQRLEYLKNLTKTIKQENIQVIFGQYLALHGGEKARVAANLCSKFLNIKGLTFIEKVRPILKEFNVEALENFTVAIYNHVISNRQQTKEAASPHPPAEQKKFHVQGRSPHSRLLFGLDQSTPNDKSKDVSTVKFSDLSEPDKLPNLETIFSGDVSVVSKNSDSSYSSYLGSTGTTVSSHVGGIPFNITREFP